MSTFITRFDAGPSALRVAVKDLIDVAGTITTAACRAVADTAEPAERDAACLAGTRAERAGIVGKTNLHELAFGASGVNAAFGTPVNPVDARRIPGGSSSGSAVAVAVGDADVAFGTDTGGSVRIPSACCATTGLKTTHGRISLEGVWPLAPSLDTVGPMARDVAGVVTGMQLLEPGFVAAVDPPTRIGRLRLPDTDPAIDAAVDAVLARCECDVVDVILPGWSAALGALGTIIVAEAFASNGHLLDRRDRIGVDVAERIEFGRAVTAAQLEAARAHQRAWQEELAHALHDVDVIALPTLIRFPPTLDDSRDYTLTTATAPINLAGTPALSLPVPASGPVPASLQITGPLGSEAALVAAGFLLEAAARQLR